MMIVALEKKLLFKKTMDEYPNVEEDTFFNSIQSKN